jgi:integrase
MPAKIKSPRYCLQKETGRPDRAYTIVNGKRIHLGTYGSPESYERYTKAVNEPAAKPPAAAAPSAPTASMLMLAYLEFAIDRYGGEKVNEVVHIKLALKVLRRTHGDTLASNFGPKAYQVMRRAMVEEGWSRSYIKDQCGRIKRMIAWGVAEELLPAGARHALDSVAPLALGQFNVRETAPVKPVEDDVIDATVAELSDTVADMVKIMRLTGMRAGELCQLSAEYIDRKSEVWIFTPPQHKTQRHGKERPIAIGPRAQVILNKYLFRSPCFKYTTTSFRRVIHRACDRAFPHPTLADIEVEDMTPAQRKELANWRSKKRWSPNRIRHTAATAIREKFGLDFAQSTLGHSRADTTQIYAEVNQKKAREAALQIG